MFQNLKGMTPKGILISVGGAEDKGTDLEKGIIERNRLNFFELGILKNLISFLKEKTDRIEVITTASSIPDEVFDNYKDAFHKLGFENVGHLRVRDREEALNSATLLALNNANAIMFSGGNQLRLSSIFGGTPFLERVKERYENEEFVIGGTSAGAMAMSSTMIYEGNAGNAHLKGEVKITTGLGFMNNVIIDSHFDKRGRFPRLAQAVASNPGSLGIGLCEDTGIIVKNGTELKVIGSGAVYLVDGRGVLHSNIADIGFGEPISVQNLKVNILCKGNRYEMSTSTFHES